MKYVSYNIVSVAGIAQRQSNGFVNRRLQVRFLLPAFFIKALVASSPCGAGVAHSLGKGEATSSNLVKGKFFKRVGLFNNSQVKIKYGQVAEWLKATDCNSVPARVRWFESTPAQILKKRLDFSPNLFFFVRKGKDENHFCGSSANELRLESFAKDKVLKHNSELQLNASEQDNPPLPKLKKEA